MISSALLTNTAGMYTMLNLKILPNDLLIWDSWHKVEPIINNMSSIDYIFFSAGVDLVAGYEPIAIQGKTTKFVDGETVEAKKDIVLMSPPARIYHDLWFASKDVNPVLTNVILGTVRKRGKVLNAMTQTNDLYREWFVKTLIDGLDA